MANIDTNAIALIFGLLIGFLIIKFVSFQHIIIINK